MGPNPGVLFLNPVLFALYSNTSQLQCVFSLISDFSIIEKGIITKDISLTFLTLPELLKQRHDDLFLQSLIYSLAP